MNDQNSFASVDWDNIPNARKRMIVEDFTKYALAMQNFTQFNAMHRNDLKCLISFLVMTAFGFFLDSKLENVVMLWVILQIFLTIISKLAQIGSAIELGKCKDKLSDSIATFSTKEDGTF